MRLIYVTCAAVGSLVLVLQLVLLVLGIGDHDAPDHDVGGLAGHDAAGHAGAGHDHGSSFNLISVRSVFAFIGMFGLVGWLGVAREWGELTTLAVAVASGFGAMLLVAWLFTLYRHLTSDGTLRPENAVGRVARVEIRVPARRAGQGRISLPLQGRTAEFQALSDGDEIPTGASVKVVQQVSPDTFLVAPVQPG
jgi:hypothetical protein